MGTKIGQYKGVDIYVNKSGTALSAPSLKLFGFAYDSNLKRAITRELKKRKTG